MPSATAIRATTLHRRVVAGDPTATVELFEMMLEPLSKFLCRKHTHALDREALYDIAVDALMSYSQSPSKFDPAQAGLFRYLTLIAEGDVLDAIRKRSRRPRVVENPVEDRQPAANSLTEDDETISGTMETRVDAIRIVERYHNEVCSDPGDERILELMLQGERDTAAFARALGLNDLDGAAARATVLRAKDKIKRRLRRLKDRLEHG